MKWRSVSLVVVTFLVIAVMTALPLTANLVLASDQSGSVTNQVKTDTATTKVLQGSNAMETANAAVNESDTTTAKSVGTSTSTTSGHKAAATDLSKQSLAKSASTSSTDIPTDGSVLYSGVAGNTDGAAGIDWYVNDQGELHLEGGTFGSVVDRTTPWKKYESEILKVVIDGKITTVANANLNYFFGNLEEAVTFTNLDNLDLSQASDTSNMFYLCKKVTNLDIAGWNTQHVANMSGMFYGCSLLTGLDLNNWNTSQVTSMENMFSSCEALTTIGVTNWDTSGLTSTAYIFSYSIVGIQYLVQSRYRQVTLLVP